MADRDEWARQMEEIQAIQSRTWETLESNDRAIDRLDATIADMKTAGDRVFGALDRILVVVEERLKNYRNSTSGNG